MRNSSSSTGSLTIPKQGRWLDSNGGRRPVKFGQFFHRPAPTGATFRGTSLHSRRRLGRSPVCFALMQRRRGHGPATTTTTTTTILFSIARIIQHCLGLGQTQAGSTGCRHASHYHHTTTFITPVVVVVGNGTSRATIRAPSCLATSTYQKQQYYAFGSIMDTDLVSVGGTHARCDWAASGAHD